VSSDLIDAFNNSINYQTEAIAITKFLREDIESSELYDISEVTVVTFDSYDNSWTQSLVNKLKKIAVRPHFDFLIFCALDIERNAFSQTDAVIGDHIKIHGMDCQYIDIDNHKGLCIAPPRMGLVNMAITATKAIEAFQPKIVAMSGICAGITGESKLLDIVIADIVWEYQTGKITDYDFKAEPYQVHMDNDLKVSIKQLKSRNDFLPSIKEGLYVSELEHSGIIIGPVVSGSAVVASKNKIQEITPQHRKMAALEMEIYSMYEAAEQSLAKPKFFAAKSVVDLADSKKADDVQRPACIISARFVEKVLSEFLPEL
jgi:nucleoside phosphorylase